MSEKSTAAAAYPFARIEREAQELWEAENAFAAREQNPRGEKFYCLSMFPYPSGRLHMGHVRNYAIGDMIARQRRMRGREVMQPMGWDAFGLPAENAAIDNKIHPARWTRDNIAQMRKQMRRLGLAIDWSREFATCDPDYYRWEQQLFARLFARGLVYRKTAPVNWDPVDNTVLANEQVIEGRGWRSGALVERREIPMYFMKITAYADELLDGLDDLPGWPDSVKAMQRNWIGRSDGARVFFRARGLDETIECYTTRPDTIFGVTFCALAPEHPLAKKLAAKNPALAAFVADCRQLAVNEEAMQTAEKKGFDTGVVVDHPLAPGRAIPLFVANFVLAQYGSGAVYGCPAHDQRDLEFARAHGLPVIPVVLPPGASAESFAIGDAAYDGDGVVFNSDFLDGLPCAQAKNLAIEKLAAAGNGRRERQFRLRDWGVSRQRYWGCPVPVVHCETCGEVAVAESDLPVLLPEDVVVDGRGSPLAKRESFCRAACPRCGGAARRETDTFDTFVESSWYFARFACPDSGAAMLDSRAARWLPVDQYIGGIEHACLHLLYARFFHKLLIDVGMFPGGAAVAREPFTRLLCQGMVVKDGAKMSKSRGNTVDPNALIESYGADTARLFALFAAPPEQSLEWSENGVKGCARFLHRLWDFVCAACAADEIDDRPDDETRRETHRILAKACYDFERLRLNNIPSAAMKILHLLEKTESTAARREGIDIVLRLLAPAAPHIAQALWQKARARFGDEGRPPLIADAAWPEPDPAALTEEETTVIVQVNGRRRAEIRIAAAAGEEEIAAAAKQATTKHWRDGEIKKIVVVGRRLANLVVVPKA